MKDLLELGAIEVGKTSRDAAAICVRLEHEDHVLPVLERIANLAKAIVASEHFFCHE